MLKDKNRDEVITFLLSFLIVWKRLEIDAGFISERCFSRLKGMQEQFIQKYCNEIPVSDTFNRFILLYCLKQIELAQDNAILQDSVSIFVVILIYVYFRSFQDLLP